MSVFFDPIQHESTDGIVEGAVVVAVPTGADKKAKPSFFDNPAQTLLRKDGSSVAAADALRDVDYVIVYCSAGWCPHCVKFTPLLKTFYEAHHVEKKFEVVFMSFDFSEAEMMTYFRKAHGDYYCLPYDDTKKIKSDWMVLYNFHTIPTAFVFQNGYPRVMTTRSGRYMVEQDPDAKEFPWPDSGFVTNHSEVTSLSSETEGKAPLSRLGWYLLIVLLFYFCTSLYR